MSFEKVYLGGSPENRDRFMVEFNPEERALFVEMQLFLGQVKDATALKQMAVIGWFAISNKTALMSFLREKLLINERNNKRLGIDPKTEIENKFQLKIDKLGWKL